MKRMIFWGVVLSVLSVQSMAAARTYKLALGAWPGYAPGNVADVKGFWKAEGLDVNVVNPATPQDVQTLFKNRQVDLAFDMIGSQVALYMEGLPVTILAETDWSHGGDKIIIKQGSDPASIKAKPIGVYFNAPPVTFFLHQYLASVGVKLSETRLIEMEPDQLATHFIAGRLSSIVCYDPEAIRAEREGHGQVVATSATYEGVIPEGIMVLDDVLAGIPEDDLVKFFKGWVKAVAWTHDPANWPEYVTILNTQTFKGAGLSEADLKAMVDAVRVHPAEMLLERNRVDGGLQQYLQALKTFLAENNLLTKDFDPAQIRNPTAVLKALQ
jgi:NitT/TauT family transport system substrate-binding protein